MDLKRVPSDIASLVALSTSARSTGTFHSSGGIKWLRSQGQVCAVMLCSYQRGNVYIFPIILQRYHLPYEHKGCGTCVVESPRKCNSLRTKTHIQAYLAT